MVPGEGGEIRLLGGAGAVALAARSGFSRERASARPRPPAAAHLLGLLGGDTRLLGGLGISLGLGLLRLLRAFGGKTSPLLLGQTRLLGGGDAGFLGNDLFDLQLGEVGIEAVRILREERLQRAPLPSWSASS